MTTQTSLTVWVTTNCGKFLDMGEPNHLTCLLRNLNDGQEATIRTINETTDWFKIGKWEQHCILSPWFLTTYMQSTSYEMLDWIYHKLESRLLGEISTASNMQMVTTQMTECEEKWKSLLMKVKVKAVQLYQTLCNPVDDSTWNHPGQNSGSLILPQGIFPNQGLNPGLLHFRWILYQLNHKGSPNNTGVGSLSLLQQIFQT